jgi:hypothetical protein
VCEAEVVRRCRAYFSTSQSLPSRALLTRQFAPVLPPPGQPEGHLQSPVQRDGGGQFSMGLLRPAYLDIQAPKAKVAICLERMHAELLGQGESLPVMGFGRFTLRKLAPRRNLAEEVQGIRLVAPFLELMGVRRRMLGEALRLLQMTSQQLRLPQGETTARLRLRSFHHSQLVHRLREQRHGIGDAPGQTDSQRIAELISEFRSSGTFFLITVSPIGYQRTILPFIAAYADRCGCSFWCCERCSRRGIC